MSHRIKAACGNSGPRAFDTQHGISSDRLFLRIRNKSFRLQAQKSLLWSVDAVIQYLKGPMVDRNAIFGTENFVGQKIFHPHSRSSRRLESEFANERGRNRDESLDDHCGTQHTASPSRKSWALRAMQASLPWRRTQ